MDNFVDKFMIVNNFNPLFKTLIVFIIIDYLTGILRAIYNKKLNSKIGAKGIIKKIGYLLIITVATLMDNLFNNTGNIKNTIIYMFIANEGISIIENWSNMGIKIPKILKDKLDSINNDK